MAQFAIDELFTTGVQISGFIFDYSSRLGTPGQVLTSTSSGVMWQADSSNTDLATLSGQIVATGALLNNRINSLSGYVNDTFISGSGITNYVPRWNGAKQLVTGSIYDLGTGVGIGTTSPVSLLSIGANNSTTADKGISFGGDAQVNLYRIAEDVLRTDANLNVLGYLTIGGYIYTSAYIQVAQGNIYPGGYTSDLNLNIGNIAGNTWETAIKIKPGSYVGIGTTEPSGKLHVVSNVAGETVLRADGTNGTLFSVTDDLSDSLMSVNNSAGLPVLEVFADDRVVAGQYGSGDFVLANNKIGVGTSNPVNKLSVIGAASIGSNSYNVIAPVNGLIIEGKVGIGTTNPIESLHISSLGTAKLKITADTDNVTETEVGGIEISQDGGITTSTFTLDDTNSLVLGVNSTTGPSIYIGTRNDGTNFVTSSDAKITILNGGNVGIGTLNPTQKLDVSGSLKIRSFGVYSDPTDNAAFLNYDTNGGIFTLSARSDAGNTYMAFRTSNGGTGSEKVRITNDGKVGIGILSPNALLSVGGVGSTSAASGLTFGGDSQANLYRISSSRIKTDGNFTIDGQGGGATSLVLNRSSTSSENGMAFNTAGVTDWYFYVDNGNNNLQIQRSSELDPRPRVRFDGANSNILFNLGGGNVGIGTDTPAGRLHVSGADGNVLFLKQGVTGSQGGVYFENADGFATSSARIYFISGDSILFTRGTSNLAWSVSQDAKVGIGVSNPSEKLTITGAVKILTRDGANFKVGDGSNNNTFLEFDYPDISTANAYFRLFRSTNTNGGKYFQIFKGDGTAGSQTLLNASGDSYINAVAGNVGVGTDNPSYKLDVIGTARANGELISDGNNARFSLFRNNGINYFDWASGQSLYFSTQTSVGGAGRNTLMTVTSGGKVGIGSVNPTDYLDFGAAGRNIVFAYAAYGEILNSAASIIGNNVKASPTGNSQVRRFASTSDAGNFIKLIYNKGVTFHTNLTSALNTDISEDTNERMRINLSGDVGIGTIAPAAKLDVVGQFANFPSGNGTITAGTILRLRNSNSNLVLDIGGNGGNGNWLQSTNQTDLSLEYPLLFNPNGGNVGIATTNPAYSLQIGQNTSGDNIDYSLGILRHGTLTYPGTWTSTPAFKIIDLADGGPSSVDIYGIMNLELPRFQASDTNAEKASLFLISFDTAMGPLRIDGKGNQWIGYDRVTTGINNSSFSSLIYGGLAVGDTYQTTTLSNGQAIFQGNVGIGTTNPSVKLVVVNSGSPTSTSTVRIIGSTGNGAGPQIEFYKAQNQKASIGLASAITGGFSDDLLLATLNPSSIILAAGVSGLATFKTDGKVGIGIRNPISLLTIGGTGSTSAASGITFGLDDQANLYRSAEDTIKTDGSLIVAGSATLGPTNINGGGLGASPVGIALTGFNYAINNGNTSQITFVEKRFATGGDWTTATTRIQKRVDVTDQAYIEFNPSGASYGMALGVGANSNVEALRILSNGSIGIGTTNPATKLHVYGAGGGFEFGVGSSNCYIETIDRANTSAFINTSYYTRGTGYFAWYNGSYTERMRITSDGNVGIGLTSASARLHIMEPNGGNDNVYQRWSYTNAVGVYDLLLKQTVTSNVVRYNFSMINNSTTYLNVLVLDRGNVGLGTTNPNYQLTVIGANQATANVTDAGNKGGSILVGSSINASNQGGSVLFATLNDANTYTSQWAIKSLFLNGQGYGIGDLAFSSRRATGDTSLTESVRFTYDGKVGIGTASPSSALDVIGTVRFNSLGAAETRSAVNQGGQRIFMPSGGVKFLGNSSTGAIRIKSPVNGSTDSMTTIKGTVFEYSAGKTFEFLVSFYYYNNTFFEFTTRIIGGANASLNRNFTIRGGRDSNGAFLIYIGELTDTWAYGYVYITEVFFGWSMSQTNLNAYQTGWDISTESSAFENVTRTNTDTQITNWSRNGTSTYYNLGKVGIGIASPSTLLSVGGVGSTTAASGITLGGDAAVNLYRLSASVLKTDADFTAASLSSSSYVYAASYLQTAGGQIYAGAPYGTLSIFVGNIAQNAWENALYIGRGSYVGIGTSQPSGKLHIVSSVAGETVLRADGTNGTLFSVTDDLSDSLMSVNNSAGLPVLEVFADDRIVAGQYGSGDLVVTNNKVGIGTTNPVNKLSVVGNVSIGSNSYNISAPTNGLIVQGDVGIGTTSAATYSSKIAVETSLTRGLMIFNPALANAETLYGLGFGYAMSNYDSAYIGFYKVGASNTLNRLSFSLWNQNDVLNILGNGNVGIGTTNPTAKLHVSGINGDEVQIGTIGSSQIVGGRSGGSFSITTKSTSNGNLILEANSAMYLRTNASNESVYIASNGNVGINSTSPTSKLNIVETTATGSRIQLGTSSESALMNAGSTNDLLILNAPYGVNSATTSNIGAKWGIKFVGTVDSSLNVNNKTCAIYAVSEDVLGYNRGTSLAFYTNEFNDISYAEKMRISHNGNIGIGVTNPSNKVQISGGISFTTPTGLAVPMLGIILASNVAYIGPYTTPTNVNAPSLVIFNQAASVQQTWFYSSGRVAMVLNREGRLNIAGNAGNTPPALLNVGGTSSVDAVSGMSFGNDSSANLYRSAASTIKTDGSLIVNSTLTAGSTTVNTLNVNGGALGSSPAGLTLTGFNYAVNNGNVSQITFVEKRFAVGTDWTTATTRIQKRTDVTDQAYIEFNPSGSLYGIAFGVGVGNTEAMRIASNGTIGIGITSTSYKLQVNGSFAATTKSFDIVHPTVSGKRLIYASLEGPENGVYYRGQNYNNEINLPHYWSGLVHEDSLTVNLTAVGKRKDGKIRNYSVDQIGHNKVYIYTDSDDNIYNYYYTIFAERKDVSKLVTERYTE